MSHKSVAFSSGVFLTVLSQTWLERNLKPVVSSVEGKIKNQDPKEKNIHKTSHVSFNCIYIYLKGKAMTLHQDLLSALFIKYN